MLSMMFCQVYKCVLYSDSKYDVFKTTPESSSSTLAFSEAIPSGKL